MTNLLKFAATSHFYMASVYLMFYLTSISLALIHTRCLFIESAAFAALCSLIQQNASPDQLHHFNFCHHLVWLGDESTLVIPSLHTADDALGILADVLSQASNLRRFEVQNYKWMFTCEPCIADALTCCNSSQSR
jgi:hypothetical protein